VLVPTWAVGRRDGFTARASFRDLADRPSTRVQLTTDGHKVYLEAVEGALGSEIDYARFGQAVRGGLGPAPAGDPLQSRAVPRDAAGLHRWRSRPAPRLDELRGASEPQHADVDERIHPLDQSHAETLPDSLSLP